MRFIPDIVVKQNIMSLKERLTFATLTTLFLFFLTQYTLWWFQPKHIPTNWTNSYLHALDIIIFSLLTFVVFIGATQRIGNLFALWFVSKPKYMHPKPGLKVAFLTCFVPGKEPIDMLVNTLKAIKAVHYPHDSWVLDEGDSNQVKKTCQDLKVRYFTRSGVAKYNREKGKFRAKTKAGNHNAWADIYAKDYEIVAQIDMDHVPEPDYFEKTLGYFKDPKVAFVGMPQFYKNTHNWIARGAAEQSYFFHGPIQKGFFGCDMPFLIGTSHIYRVKAMEQIGGYAPTIVEDHLTGMNFYAHGWKGVFVPEILAKGDGPLNWVDYFNQQMRWSYGLFEIFFKHTPKIIFKLKLRQMINYFLAQLYYLTGVAVVVGLILTYLYLTFGIRAASMNLFEWLKLALPPYLLSVSIQIYVQRFSINPQKEPAFGPLGMFLNLGANLIYALAFTKFILGRKLSYMVTQKGSAGEKQSVPLATFKLHIPASLLMLTALTGSFSNSYSAPQLRFWALFNTLTLGAVVLSIYWEKIRSELSWFKLEYRPVKYAFSTIFGIFIFAIVTVGYSHSNTIVQAFIDQQNIILFDEPISGKISMPKSGVYLGVSLYQHNDIDSLNHLQQTTGKKFAIVAYYQSWGVKENKFDKDFAKNISGNGSVLLITWEPWEPISGFDRSESVVDQKHYRLKNIIDGQYDDYISQYAKDIKMYKKPILIRFAHEMNGNWYPWGSTLNKPQEYVLAWRHVREIFDGVGAINVTWIWSPNEAYFENKVPYAHQIELFYPGETYVDWVGFSAFNWAGNYKQNVWRSPEDIYDYTFAKLKKFNKPIMITETASAESKLDKDAKAKWISQLSKYIKERSEIKGMVWFNTQDNGVNWVLDSSQDSISAFKDSFDGYFLDKIQHKIQDSTDII